MDENTDVRSLFAGSSEKSPGRISLFSALQKSTLQTFNTASSVSSAYTHRGNRLTESYTYDAAGRRTRILSPYYDETRSYDAAGRLEEIREAITDKSLSYQRDKTGRVRRLISPEGQTDYLRNARGQVSRIEAPEGNYAFEYDAAGRIIQKNYPNARVDYRIFDPAGRISSEFFLTKDISKKAFSDSDLLEAAGSSIPARMGWNDYDTRVKIAGGRIKAHVQTLNEAGRLDDYALYLYDKSGNLKASLSRGHARFHRYDNEDRLIETYGTNEFYAEYRYDLRGNILKRQIRRQIDLYTYGGFY